MANQFYAENSRNRYRLRRQLRLATQFPDEVAEEAMPVIGEALVTEVKESLVGPGSGRVYRKSNPKRIHVASAPFEPPATDLGRLIGSYSVLRITKRPTHSVEVGSHVEYAPHLEYGTRQTAPNGTVIVMQPRPHLRPAAARTAAKIPGILQGIARQKGIRLRSGR